MRMLRNPSSLALWALLVALGASGAGAAQQPGGKSGGDKQGGRDGRGLLEQVSTFQTDVPAHPFNIVLVRPTATSITVSIVSNTDVEGYVELLGPSPRRTPSQTLRKGEPALFVLEGLRPDTAYTYCWRYREIAPDGKATGAASRFTAGDTCSFHTARAPGGTFTFTIQADSHLDPNMTPAVYLRTLANALADKPDFHVDLGDTFMTDKRRDFHDALAQYFAQRYYFGQLCRSAPLFMVLGNHDGEYGYGGAGPDQMAGWSFDQRTRLFPPPEIGPAGGGMYSGRTARHDGVGSNSYAFEWGDALLVVLDPFWPTRTKVRGGGSPDADTALTDQSWALTLGREQYDWLDRTLAASNAAFKFVFIHHLVGGLGKDARGGVESAPYFEWGGRNADGSDGFATHRPGWPMPIHRLLVARGVAAVFHGHDHLYVRSELDGIVYQCVAQPGNPRGGIRSAAEYGYRSGTILDSPGHLRVTVSPGAASVAFIRASTERPTPSRRGGDIANGSVAAEYALTRKHNN